MSTLIIGPEGNLKASGTRAAFGALSDALVAEGHPPIRVNYGDRELADEIRIFTDRYRQQASGGGPFGDVRTWNGAAHGYPGGTRWVRHSPAGTVAPPGSSNHGKRRSADLAYPYNSDTAAHRRAQTLAKRHNITAEGMNFREWWHWTFWGPLGPITAGAADKTKPARQEDTEMKAIELAGAPDSGIIIQAATPPASMPRQVFDTLCSIYGLTSVVLPDWKYGTAVREQWGAASSAAALHGNKVINVDINDDDAETIAKKVRDGLALTWTVTSTE